MLHSWPNPEGVGRQEGTQEFGGRDERGCGASYNYGDALIRPFRNLIALKPRR